MGRKERLPNDVVDGLPCCRDNLVRRRPSVLCVSVDRMPAPNQLLLELWTELQDRQMVVRKHLGGVSALDGKLSESEEVVSEKDDSTEEVSKPPQSSVALPGLQGAPLHVVDDQHALLARQ